MKEIIVYVAEDNQRFDSQTDCLAYENLLKNVGKIMELLPIRPNSCDFLNGSGYIQHLKNHVLKVRKQLLELCKPYTDHHWIRETINDNSIHISYVSSTIGEYDELKPVSKALRRLELIDSEFKEWGQPYFIDNTIKAKNIRLNK